jgi:hypothetical protein
MSTTYKASSARVFDVLRYTVTTKLLRVHKVQIIYSQSQYKLYWHPGEITIRQLEPTCALGKTSRTYDQFSYVLLTTVKTTLLEIQNDQ